MGLTLTHLFAFPRHGVPELCIILAPSISKGRSEGRVQAAPMARQQIKSWRQSPQVWPDIRPSLRNGK
jgi:hypothetical protein